MVNCTECWNKCKFIKRSCGSDTSCIFLWQLYYTGKFENNDISHEKNEEDEDSDDSDDMFNDPNFGKNVASKTKSASGGNIPIAVSKPIVQGEEVKFVAVVGDSGPGRLYYNKPENVGTLFKMRTESRKTPFFPTNDIHFEDTMKGIILRDAPSSISSKFRRNQNNKTVELLSFTITLPRNRMEDISAVVETIMNDYFKYIFAKKRNKNTVGELALTYAKELIGNATSPTGLYGHLLGKYGDGNFDTAAKNMTAEMNKYWSKDITYEYNCHLDKYMVNYEIKKWVEQHMGVTSWSDLSEEVKNICFKSYPGRDLPEWSDIVQEQF